MPRGLGIDAMGDALYEGSFDRISKDCLKDGGRFLPIRSTLLRIPVAAFGLKKYFSGTSRVSMHGNNVDATALLGDSEVFAVKHTPRDTIPEFVQRLEYDSEVASSVAREKAMHIFEDNSSWKTSSNEAHEVVKESRLGPSKPRSRPHSCQREVLAGESSHFGSNHRQFSREGSRSNTEIQAFQFASTSLNRSATNAGPLN
jgi:hypothetical protein